MKPKKIIYRSDCPISTALDLFGDKWSLLIIRDMLFKGKNTYGDFLKGGESIATNILADRLAQLESAGIITKTPHPNNKVKILYSLTSRGVDLAPVLVEIIAWSAKHNHVHPQAVAFAREIKKDKAAILEHIHHSLR